MNNGLMCDPLHPLVKEIKKITSKGRKQTDDDHMRRYRLEWEGALYWNETLGPVIPTTMIERLIQLGASKSKKGKDVAAACICSLPEVKLEYKGPRTQDELYAQGFFLKVPVVVNRGRIMKCRPKFPPGWWLVFDLEYDKSIINEATLVDACDDAGALIGLGDWKPRFGRFESELI